MQDQYNLMQREEEREMFGLLADQGVGSSRGARSPRDGSPGRGATHTTRSDNDPARPTVRQSTATGRSSKPSSASPKLAASRWPRSRSPGCSTTRSSPRPSSDATKPHHLADAVAALDVDLTDDEITTLEAPYTPHTPDRVLNTSRLVYQCGSAWCAGWWWGHEVVGFPPIRGA